VVNHIFNTIVKIATNIENDLFSNYNDYTNKDVYNYCNNLINKECLKNSDIKAIISQDSKQLEVLNNNGKYILCYVGVDNIDLMKMNFSLGSIFAIYENEVKADNLRYSCYVTYGPTFQIVFASQENGISFFSYDGKQFTKQNSFTLNQKGKINSQGGDVTTFEIKHKTIMQDFFDEGYRLRFSNSLALDTHQILFKKGGIYSSPSTLKNKNGILNLVFEAYPISMIIELAGGESIDGKNRILDIKLDSSLNKKTPIYFGSKYEIKRVKEVYCIPNDE
jgi:fructose-1,6-bisphosphatase I